MAILNNMWITIELPRRDGEKDATIPGQHEAGDVALMWHWCDSGVIVVQSSSK